MAVQPGSSSAVNDDPTDSAPTGGHNSRSSSATQSKLDAAFESISRVRQRQSQQVFAHIANADSHRPQSPSIGADLSRLAISRNNSTASSGSSRLPAAADPEFQAATASTQTVASSLSGPSNTHGSGNKRLSMRPASIITASIHPSHSQPLPVANGAYPPSMSRSGSRQAIAGDIDPPRPSAETASTQTSMPPPTSAPLRSGRAGSEDWADRGASRHVEHVTVNGVAQTRYVKKGVRDFSFGRTLGEGSYSTVVAATDRQTLKEYAIKVLDKRHIIKEKKVKYVNIEKNTLFRLVDHPGIVRLYYTFQDEASLYFVLDLAANGELLGVLKRLGTFDEECSRYYAAQILDSIDYMHKQGVIHRDLKPENVLLDGRMRVKIADFGTAKLLDLPAGHQSVSATRQDGHSPESDTQLDGIDQPQSDRSNSFVGTAEYVSPELLTDKSTCKASDLWALGCIIYQLLVGKPPFKAGNEYQTFQKIVQLDYVLPPNMPDTAKDIITRLLVLDPAARLTISQIRDHPFFGDLDWTNLWTMKAPQLRPYRPPSINLNSVSGQPTPSGSFNSSAPKPLPAYLRDENAVASSESGGGSSHRSSVDRGRPISSLARDHDNEDDSNGAEDDPVSDPDSPPAHPIPTTAPTNVTSHDTSTVTLLDPPTEMDLRLARLIDLSRERVIKMDKVSVMSTSSGTVPRKFNRLLHKKKSRSLLVTSLGRCLVLDPFTDTVPLPTTIKAEIDLADPSLTIRPRDPDSRSLIIETSDKSWRFSSLADPDRWRHHLLTAIASRRGPPPPSPGLITHSTPSKPTLLSTTYHPHSGQKQAVAGGGVAQAAARAAAKATTLHRSR
ncbi:serine/threonine protein kinase [Savitreella phatthalungensis]